MVTLLIIYGCISFTLWQHLAHDGRKLYGNGAYLVQSKNFLQSDR